MEFTKKPAKITVEYPVLTDEQKVHLEEFEFRIHKGLNKKDKKLISTVEPSVLLGSTILREDLEDRTCKEIAYLLSQFVATELPFGSLQSEIVEKAIELLENLE